MSAAAESEMLCPIQSPIGEYHAVVSATGVRALAFPGSAVPAHDPAKPSSPVAVDGCQAMARWLERELLSYHEGALRRFTVPMDLRGHTSFRLRVWEEMTTIPYGETLSYGELAERVGCGAPRAVGQACGANPIVLLVPCHRVTGKGGGIGGWSGPAGLKEQLLALEQQGRGA